MAWGMVSDDARHLHGISGITKEDRAEFKRWTRAYDHTTAIIVGLILIGMSISLIAYLSIILASR